MTTTTARPRLTAAQFAQIRQCARNCADLVNDSIMEMAYDVIPYVDDDDTENEEALESAERAIIDIFLAQFKWEV